MQLRGLRILIAAFWFFWTSIVIPGHTRGIVPEAGSACCEPAAKSCCDASDKQPSDSSQKPVRNAQNCAICTLAVKLTRGPAITLAPVRLGFVEIRPPVVVQPPVLPDSVLPRQCRDPPVI